MPRYQVTAPDGRTVTLEGDTPPTDADLDQIFSSLPPPVEPGVVKRGLGMVGDVLTGVAKEAPLTAERMAAAPQRAVSGLVSGALKLFGAPDLAQRVQDQEALAKVQTEAPFVQGPDATGAEKLGRFGVKAAPTTALAAMTGGASIPIQSAVSGVSQGTQTLAEGGSLGEAGLSAGLGAVAGAVAPPVAKLAKYLAPRVVNSLIKPLSQAFRFGKDPGRGVVNEGITALTRPQLAQQLTDKLDELGSSIRQNLTVPEVAKKAIDIRPAIAEVDKAIAEGAKRGERALLARLQDLKQSLTHELDAATGEWSNVKPTSLSPLDAHALKREVGEATKWTGQAFDNEVNQARVAFYRKLNELIGQAAPGTRALQARYADILTAKSALERTMTMQGRNNILGLPDVIIGTTGLGAALLNPPAALAAAGTIAGRHLLGSAGGKTIGAQLLKRFPNLSPELQLAIRGWLEGGDTTAEGNAQ